MYSLIRVWIGLKLASRQIHVSVVVRTTSAADSPSTPSLYWMPNSGIQSTTSTYWNPASAGTNRASRTSDATQVASANASATGRVTDEGSTATTRAPTSGRKVMIERIGMPLRSIA